MLTCTKFKPFSSGPKEIYINDGSKLTLHGLQQYYLQLEEKEKNRKLVDLLDALELNQVIIFVKSVERADMLNRLLNEENFPSICTYGRLEQDKSLYFPQYKSFLLPSSRISLRRPHRATFSTWCIMALFHDLYFNGSLLMTYQTINGLTDLPM
jgi:hypothetical protein